MVSHKSQLLGNIEVFNSEGTLKYNKPLGTKEKKPDRLILKVKDKLGKLKRKKILPFKSFNEKYTSVLNYALQDINNDTAFSSPEKIEGTDGNAITADEYNLELTAPSSEKTYGVVIGTGTADPNWTDNDLVSQETTDWAHGTTSITMKPKTVGGNNWNRIKVTRRFTNNTDSPETIKEVGLVCVTANNSEKFLIARDNKDGDLNYSGTDVNALNNISIEVANGEILEVTYEFYIDEVENGIGFTSNWLSIIGSKMKRAAINARAIDGTFTAVDFSGGVTSTDITANAGETRHGLIVSQNDTTPYISDYTFDEIEDGSSDGQLEYKAMQTIDMEQKDENGVYYSQMGFYREFENTSTVSLEVKDVNLVSRNSILQNPKDYLIARSLVGVQVEAGDTLRISMYIKHILDNRFTGKPFSSPT